MNQPACRKSGSHQSTLDSCFLQSQHCSVLKGHVEMFRFTVYLNKVLNWIQVVARYKQLRLFQQYTSITMMHAQMYAHTPLLQYWYLSAVHCLSIFKYFLSCVLYLCVYLHPGARLWPAKSLLTDYDMCTPVLHHKGHVMSAILSHVGCLFALFT